MNRFASVTRPLMWFMAFMLAALTAGCGGGSGGGAPILGLPGVVSLTVTPATATVPVTGFQQYTATAVYSDGSSRNVTATSTWTKVEVPVVVGTVVATLSADGPTGGLATGKAAGTSTITATFGGRAATATLTVNTATSTKFEVKPSGVAPNPLVSIPVTGTQQYTAIETFSDGTTFDRTTPAAAAGITVWSSSDITKATVGAATGLATGVKDTTVTPPIGLVTITATFTPAGVGAVPLVATAKLTVTAATMTKFEVLPSGVAPSALVSIPVTGTQQYTAIETFSDGTTQDRTAPLAAAGITVWSSSDITKATVGAATGLATGVKDTTVTPPIGLVTITATFTPAGVGAVPLVATAKLTVNAATMTKFEVLPSGVAPNPLVSIPVTGTQQYAAIETFSDGTTFDRTTPAAADGITLWSTSDLTKATVGAATGLATGVADTTVTPPIGPVSINATFTPAGVGAVPLVATPAKLTVTPAPVPPASPVLALNLRSAGTFGIVARGGLTSTGVNQVNGDVALTPTATCTDFGVAAPGCLVHTYANPLGLTVSKSIWWAADPAPGDGGATASAALFDLNLAWVQGMNMADTVGVAGTQVLGGGVILAGQLGGKTFLPGVYSVPALALNLATGTTATFDATGTPDPANASWIIKVGSSFTDSGIAATPSIIKLAGGALARNIWFVVQLDASMGIGTTWNGNILAGRAITMTNNSIVNGRMLAGADPLLAPAAQSISLSGGIAPGTIITVPQ